MELFGFASGSSASGPHFPFLPESILKNYPTDLMEHPSVPSLPVTSVSFTSMDLPSLLHAIVDSSTSMWQKPLARHIVYGILAAAVAYGAWKISLVWNTGDSFRLDSKSEINLNVEVQKRASFHQIEANNSTQKSEVGVGTSSMLAIGTEDKLTKADVERIISNLPQKPNRSESATSTTDIAKILTGGEITSATQVFQRQLIDALSRLDDVRIRLKELEGEKELLAAEIDLRKKMIHKLQDENTTERDKRQQAELRMEMMEIENSQLRHMRKELSLRTGQVERLEKFLREKETLQEKLFEENVVLPRSVAETRAKEFGTLQTRIQKLEAEIANNRHLRELEMRCQSSKSSCSLVADSPSVTKSRKRKGVNNPRPQSPSEVKSIRRTSPSNKIQVRRGTPNLSRSHSPSEHNITGKSLASIINSTSGASNMPGYNDNMAAPKPRPLEIQASFNETEHLSTDKISDKCAESQQSFDGKQVTPMPSNSCSDNAESTPGSCSSSQRERGVFAQLKAFITGYKESSSESDYANLTEGPGILDGFLTGSSDHNNDRANNNILRNEGCMLSDEQSSVFMSASGGSVTSEVEKKKNRNRSFTKKTTSVRKLARYSRGRLKEKEKPGKRRVPAKHVSGATVPPIMGETLSSQEQSSNTSATSTAKNSPIDLIRNTIPMPNSTNENQSKDVLSSDSSDGNDADSGDSWIVIMPTVQ